MRSTTLFARIREAYEPHGGDGRHFVQRLGAAPDWRVSLASVAIGAVAIRLSLPGGAELDATRMTALLVHRYFWELVSLAAVAAVAPSAWLPGVHAAAIGLTFLACAIDTRHPVAEGATTLALWGACGLLSWKLPVERAALRRVVIVAVTSGMVLAARWLTYSQGIVLLQFLFVCEAMARRPGRTWLECQRASSAVLMNTPPDELLASTRAPSSIWLGVSLVVGAELTTRLLDWLFRCGSTTLFYCVQSAGLSMSDVALGEPTPISTLLAAARQSFWLLYLAPQIFVVAGVLRFFGVPVSMPMGNLFGARNLIDYWKRVNTWRYRLLQRVYIDNFFVLDAGWAGAIGVVAIFLVSGLHQAVGSLGANGSLVRTLGRLEVPWLIEGVLCSLTFQWLVVRMRKRVRRAVRGERTIVHGGLQSAVVGAACLVAVLVAEGLSMSAEEVYACTKPYWIGRTKTPDEHAVGSGRGSGEVPGGWTRSPPAVAAGGLAAYAAWRRPDADGAIWWTALVGHRWIDGRSTGVAHSPFPPALGLVGDAPILVWTTEDVDSNVEWSRLGPKGWSAPVRLEGAHAGTEPQVAVDGDRVYVSWRVAGPSKTMEWTRIAWPQGSAEGPRPIGTWDTGAAPAVAIADGALYGIWKGNYDAESIWWSRLDGDVWSEPKRIDGVTPSSGPSVVSAAGAIHVVWRGSEGYPDVHWAELVKGEWRGDSRIGLATCDRPGVAAYGRGLVVVTRGKESGRCSDKSDYGGDWDLVTVWATGLDTRSARIVPVLELSE